MNISKLIVVPEDSDVARVYQWKTNHLTLEELLAFMSFKGKIPQSTGWNEKTTEDPIYDAI